MGRNVHLQQSKRMKETVKKQHKLNVLVISLILHNSLRGELIGDTGQDRDKRPKRISRCYLIKF